MLTLAYIGNGKSANRYHMPFVLQRPDKLRVKTIFDLDVVNVKWDKIEGVHYTSDISEIMDDADIDLVVICTQPKFHYEYAKMALQHGKNVLVEKPFMETSEQAREIFALAEEKGLLVQCYQNRRYDADFLTVQKVIESGKLGEIIEVEMGFDYYRPETPENSTSFVASDSYLYGHGCHTIDQVVSYFGIPDDVVYDVRSLCGKDKMSDYFDLDLFYGNMKVSVRSSYFRVKRRPSFVVYGKKGMFIKETPDRQEEFLKLFYMPDQPGFAEDDLERYGTLTYVDEQGIHEEKVPTVMGDYGRVYDALYETLVNGVENPVKPEQTLCVMDILETGASTVEAHYC